MSRIRKMLELSNRHLPERVCDSLSSFDNVAAYDLVTGWLLWVPDDPGCSDDAMDEPVPAEVLAVQRYARSMGCDNVLFDSEVDLDDQLPVWDW